MVKGNIITMIVINLTRIVNGSVVPAGIFQIFPVNKARKIISYDVSSGYNIRTKKPVKRIRIKL